MSRYDQASKYKMKVIKDKKKCLMIAQEYFTKNKKEFLTNWHIKNTLNKYTKPDEYLFFQEKDFLLPFVVKENIAYFFGGDAPFNDYNVMTKNCELLNSSLIYLLDNHYEFRLTSIKNDYYELLDDKLKKYDVPFNQNWVIENIKEFDLYAHINNQKKKRRDKIKRALKTKNSFNFINTDNATYREKYLKKIFNLIVESFKIRNKKNCWEENYDLYEKLFKIFFNNDCINKVITDNTTGQILASYNLVLNRKNNEIFLAFSNCYDSKSEGIQSLVYADIIETSKSISDRTNQEFKLNAGRGNFSYKSRMGFKPEPMYAIVNDRAWSKEYNKDLTQQETKNIYLREFGCFL